MRAIGMHQHVREVGACVLSDRPDRQDFPKEVIVRVARDNRADYQTLAAMLNASAFDAVSVQHEFGIYGGDEGAHVLELLSGLRKPVVTTLHTVLANPTKAYHRRLREVVDASDAVAVLTPHATRILVERYGVDGRNVHVIPHGIPDAEFVEPDSYARRIGTEGRLVIMTFGLIGRNKGIGEMIDAMPAIVERHPEALYLVVGATHPSVLAAEGESYRFELEAKTAKLGLAGHVVFHNRYLTDVELRCHLGACTIYVTPYPNPEQISSGTLAYAVGMGKAVVSTPYWYARDLLADGRGTLVPFSSPAALAGAINDLIDDASGRDAMRLRAFEFGRGMRWPRVADSYVQLFTELIGSGIPVASRWPASVRVPASATFAKRG